SRVSVREAAADGSRASTSGRRRLRGALVAAEVGLAVVLAIGAALLADSFVSVMRVDAGFRADHLLTMQINVPQRAVTADERLAFYAQLFERLGGGARGVL